MFAARGSHTWSRLYDDPADVFEDSMNQRRRFVGDYVDQKLDPDSRVLDLGCGAGVIAGDLVDAGMDVTAMDLSMEMVESARDRLLALTKEKARVLRGDSENLPFRDGDFDAIVCLGVISFLQSNEPMLSEMRRVLRDDGTLILAVRNRYALAGLMDVLLLARHTAGRILRWLKRIAKGELRSRNREVPIPRLFNLSGLVAELGRAGFSALERKYIGYGPFTVHGRQLLSPASSIRLSHRLDRIFRLPLLRVFQGTADVCIIVARKEA
jgi:ubiquinone/menaquinone biosynthesis C-methylase UbiE